MRYSADSDLRLFTAQATNPGGVELEKSSVDGKDTVSSSREMGNHMWGMFSFYVNMATNPSGIGFYINGKPFNGEFVGFEMQSAFQ